MVSYKFKKSELSEDLIDWNFFEKRREKIEFWDETLRDGLQQVGVYVSVEDRLRVAEMLDEVGISWIDAGLPMVSEEEIEALKKTNQLGLKARVTCAVRTKKSDVDSALKADCSSISAFVGSSLPRLKKEFKKSVEELSQNIVEVIEYAKEHGLHVIFVTEDTTRAYPEHIKILYENAEDAGADMHIISDTVGCAMPQGIRNLLRFFREEVNIKKPLSFHGHNDLDLAVANSVAAAEEGCLIPHVTSLGFGERSGNTPFESLAVVMHLMGFQHNIKLEKLQDLAKLVSEVYKIPIPVNKPVVGRNAHRHDSGIHVSGILHCGVEIYSPYLPKLVGKNVEIALGKGCGVANVLWYRKDLDKEIAFEVAKKIKEISLERGRRGEEAVVEPQELGKIVEEVS